MATYTSNYNLTKPTMAESADIRVINGNMDTVDEIMHSTQVSMADAFDSTATYAIRDVVMYEFELYQCIHPHTGAWDANDFVRVNAAEVGGNYVEITPTYNTGLKVANTNIDGDQDEIDVPYFGGATAQQNGTGGAVPAPTSSDVGKFLSSNGGWEVPSGGGGGTTVVPNPVGEPTDELETVQIGNTIFSIPGSGGGSGSSEYSETNLWTNTNGSGDGTYTLNDSIDNYDFISVRYGQWGDYTGNNPLCEYRILAVKDLQAMHTAGKMVIFSGYASRTFYSDWDGDQLVISNVTDYQIPLQIDGIKFGGGGNTAEIIPITAGDDTAIRTFTFSKTPKFIKFYWGDPVISGGWASDAELVWGQPYMNYRSKPMGATISQVDGGINSISYGVDGKSLTITGGNAFGAFNTSNGSGLMFVDYGDGGITSHVYDDNEKIVGEWFGETLYEKSIVLRENGTDNYTYSSEVYQSCLPAFDFINITQMYVARGDSVGYVDTAPNQNELYYVPNKNGNLYFKSTHSPTDIVITVQYTKPAV